MRPWLGAVAVLGGLGLAVGMTVFARVPEAGVVWRTLFVATALLGCGFVLWLARWWRPSLRGLLLWAVLGRLLVFPMLPTLSDDGYRYLWDGMVLAEGHSPYASQPSDPAFASFHDSVLYERMNSRDYASVYPPASQVGFRIAALALPLGWAWAWYTWKAIVVLAELAGVWVLARLVGTGRAVLYALHPLALVEVAGQGHTEGLLIGAMALAVYGLQRRSAWAGVGGVLAACVKLWPVVWLPTLIRLGGRRAMVAGAVVAAALVGPYLTGGAWGGPADSLSLYVGTFDFYAAPYRALKSVLHPLWGGAAGPVAAWALAVGWGALAVGVTLSAARRPPAAVRVLAVTVVGYVLASTTLHPWHLLAALWIVPLLENSRWLLWLTSVSLATYISYVWGAGVDLVLVFGWGGAAGIAIVSNRGALLDAILRRRARWKAARIVPSLTGLAPGDEVLDLGAGEGYVGQGVGRYLGAAVRSVDVVAYAGPEVTVEVYDGRRLAVADNAVDATILVFVLHHAEDPVEVLLEAVRATQGPVVVLETVCYGPLSKRWLEWVDRRVNRLRSRGHIDEAPLDIRTDADWERTFDATGLRVTSRRRWAGLHPQALYVIDGHASRVTSGTAASRASSHVASS